MTTKVSNSPETAKSASRRFSNGENIVRLWRFAGSYFLSSSKEAKAVARATGELAPCWAFPAEALEITLPRLARSKTKLARSENFVFERVSGLEGFEEALADCRPPTISAAFRI